MGMDKPLKAIKDDRRQAGESPSDGLPPPCAVSSNLPDGRFAVSLFVRVATLELAGAMPRPASWLRVCFPALGAHLPGFLASVADLHGFPIVDLQPRLTWPRQVRRIAAAIDVDHRGRTDDVVAAMIQHQRRTPWPALLVIVGEGVLRDLPALERLAASVRLPVWMGCNLGTLSRLQTRSKSIAALDLSDADSRAQVARATMQRVRGPWHKLTSKLIRDHQSIPTYTDQPSEP
jgi:hypothetical protein